MPELDYKESWAPKNWCCWTVVLEKTLEIVRPLDCKQANQSILKEVIPEYSLEGLMLKLKLQYFGHLMRSVDSLEKTLMLGEIEGRRTRGWQRMRWLDGITDSMDMSMGSQRVRHDWATELNWGTDVFCVYYFNQSFLQYTGLETIISTVLQRGYWITHINIKQHTTKMME